MSLLTSSVSRRIAAHADASSSTHTYGISATCAYRIQTSTHRYTSPASWRNVHPTGARHCAIPSGTVRGSCSRRLITLSPCQTRIRLVSWIAYCLAITKGRAVTRTSSIACCVARPRAAAIQITSIIALACSGSRTCQRKKPSLGCRSRSLLRSGRRANNLV